MPPYTYSELQQFTIDRRRLQQRSDDAASSPSELVGTVEDLAAKLRAFASDGVVVKHLVEFALPPKKRANAAEVTAKGASAAAGSQSSGQGDTTEHTKANRSDGEEADDQRLKDADDNGHIAVVLLPVSERSHCAAHYY